MSYENENNALINDDSSELAKIKQIDKNYHFIYRIEGIDYNLFLEFKAGKNKQSQSQIDFQNLYKDSKNSFYYVVYSVEEAINILIKHNVITD